ncbi:galactose-specific lectin nattectin-like [Stigmatopora nigra]
MEFSPRFVFLLCGISGLLTGVWSKPAAPKIENSCPQGWTQLDCHCYKYEDDERTFADAESVCNILGGNMVSIHNDLENAFVLELIKAAGNNDEAWIGLSDAIEGSTFLWTDGSDNEYENFADGEPNETGSCVEIDTDDGSWDDILCSAELPYVCIRDILH